MLLAKLEGNPKIDAARNTIIARMLERYRAVVGGGSKRVTGLQRSDYFFRLIVTL
ncbi:MAG: hypothetical protein QOF19_1734 [Alphaproteobacteria bacterium]|jgi:hypothetical protein|nr:hypothetical protein [Alphaproteobacteria bacterium]